MKRRYSIGLTLVIASSLWSPQAAVSADEKNTSGPVDVKTGDASLAVPAASRDVGISREVLNGINAIRDYGPRVHPEVYTGVSTNDPASIDILVIYLTTTDSNVQSEFAKASGVPDSKLRFAVGSRTETGFAERNIQFARDRETLLSSGIDLRGWGVGAGHLPEVYVRATDEGIATLTERYGKDIGFIRDWDESMFQNMGSRIDDNSQWYGGDFLDIAGAGVGATIGYIGSQSYNPNGYDAALIVADGSRGIWTVSSAAPSGVITVQAVLDPWDGAPACTSGAYEGEWCNWRFSGSPTCFPWPSSPTGQWCNLQKMINPSMQAVGPGDSGGPVYASIGGTVYGFAIIKGANSSVVCSNWSVQFQNTRKCENTGYVNRLSGIMSQWNLELDP